MRYAYSYLVCLASHNMVKQSYYHLNFFLLLTQLMKVFLIDSGDIIRNQRRFNGMFGRLNTKQSELAAESNPSIYVCGGWVREWDVYGCPCAGCSQYVGHLIPLFHDRRLVLLRPFSANVDFQ